MKKNDIRFIGVTGTNASGKGAVTDYLVQLGFEYLSLSDLLREKVLEQGLPIDRKNLTQMGQNLRKQSGAGFLAQICLTKIKPDQAYVIDSIRHPEEVQILTQALPQFELWGVDAPVELRYQRAMERGRDENAVSLQEFILQENKEKTDNPHAQQIHNTLALAQKTIMNDTHLDQLHQTIDSYL